MKKQVIKDKKSYLYLKLKKIDFADELVIFSYELIKNGKRV